MFDTRDFPFSFVHKSTRFIDVTTVEMKMCSK